MLWRPLMTHNKFYVYKTNVTNREKSENNFLFYFLQKTGDEARKVITNSLKSLDLVHDLSDL